MPPKQYTELLSAVVRCIPRGLSSEVAQRWITDQKALAEVLLSALSATVESLPRHLIDCDASPFTPSSWRVEEHKKGGQLVWDPTKVVLHLSANQQGGETISGHDLHKELAGLPVLNANVLDYLLKNPEIIPESWKGQSIFFWGTIYRGSGGNLCVRGLCGVGGRWYWGCYWLDDRWRDHGPAAVYASV